LINQFFFIAVSTHPDSDAVTSNPQLSKISTLFPVKMTVGGIELPTELIHAMIVTWSPL
jgi:hypothetical protein